MKKTQNSIAIKLVLGILITLSVVSCNGKRKSNEIANYSYSSEVKLNKALKDKVGSWIKLDMECYGIIIMVDNNNKAVNAKPIKSKVVHITPDAIQMKAVESISLAPTETCNKMGLNAGDTWWEKDGELFQDYNDALDFCKKIIGKSL